MKVLMKSFSIIHHFVDNPNELLDNYPVVAKRIGKYSVDYLNVPATFDIESSSFYDTETNEKRAVMYAWVFGVNGRCVRGRTWNEFHALLDFITDGLSVSQDKRLVVYIHNFSYEFQFIRKHFNWIKVFSLSERQPIYAVTDTGIEFRCSYLLSGYSLEMVGKNLRTYKVNKMVGDLDYDLLRLPITPLTDTEWGYILNDGLVVMAFIQEEIDRLGTIVDLPITKTGYVRNYCRERCLTIDVGYQKLVHSLTLEPNEYSKLKEAFAGGFTHANHNWVDKNIFVGKTVNGKEIKSIGSYDLTSSYPTVMVSEMFPMSKGLRIKPRSQDQFFDYLQKYCCLITVRFHNIDEIFSHEHYISKSKCLLCENDVVDNGRVVSADDIIITLTELDFDIIRKTYSFEYFQVIDMWIYRKSYIPREFVMCVLGLYADKTKLKGVAGEEIRYLKSKEMLNSLYGMCVTDICRDDIVYEDGLWTTESCNVEKVLQKYNENTQRFISYPWGVWVTAYARYNLWKILIQLNEDYVYADTDSLKIINYEKYIPIIEKYNRDITEKIKKCLAFNRIDASYAKPKNNKGEIKPLGVWDFEGSLTRFKTLGAKRYIYEHNSELTLTISGVNKETGIQYLKDKYKTPVKIFNAFKDNLEFPSTYVNSDGLEKRGCGKLTHTYLDEMYEGYAIDYLGNKSFYREFSGTHLELTTYSMSMDEAFLSYLLKGTASWLC